jgi:hypothetical protein
VAGVNSRQSGLMRLPDSLIINEAELVNVTVLESEQ